MKTLAPVAPATLAFAKGLFTRGTDCFGPAEIEQVFGIKLAEVPPIPFSEEELTQARKLGQFLILFVDKGADGQALTMKRLQTQFEDTLGDGKLLYNTDWYAKESFFTGETPTLGWKLVSREFIEDSAGVNYLVQTDAVAVYVRETLCAGITEVPHLYKEALDEFESRRDELEKLMNKDWEKAAEELANLKLNQLFRETPVEVLYRLIVYYTINKERHLETTYTWTKVRSSDGRLVIIGECDSVGVRVGGYGPRGSGSDLGVCFSRSAVPLES